MCVWYASLTMFVSQKIHKKHCVALPSSESYDIIIWLLILVKVFVIAQSDHQNEN